MTKRMGCDILIDLRLFLIILDDLPEALTGHSVAGDVDEEGFFIHIGHHFGTNVIYVLGKRLDGSRIERDDSHLAGSTAFDKTTGDVDIGHIQIDQFADTNTGRIMQFQQSLIAITLLIGTLRLFQ